MKREEKEFFKKSKEIVKLIAKKELKENQIKGVDILPVTKTENIVHIIKENLKNSKEKNYSILDPVTNILSQIENSSVAGGEFYHNKKNIKINLSTIK